jgi:hypothetical protein
LITGALKLASVGLVACIPAQETITNAIQKDNVVAQIILLFM